MNDAEFRVLLNLCMVSDPSPLPDAEDAVFTALLDRESVERGFGSWPVAYHESTSITDAIAVIRDHTRPTRVHAYTRWRECYGHEDNRRTR